MLTIGLACVSHDAFVLLPVYSPPVHQSVLSSSACGDGYCFLHILAQLELNSRELIRVPEPSLQRSLLYRWD